MKKLVVLSMLILAAFLVACGGGVATVAPPEQTQNYQHALETANAPTVEVHTEVATESQGGEVTATEPTLPPTTEAATATELPTEIATETEMPTEVVTEVATEGVVEGATETATELATEAVTPTEEATEAVPPTEILTQVPTIPPTEPPTTEPTTVPTLEPTTVPSEIPTEEGGTGGESEQTATLPPTETAVPSPTATDTATSIPTDTPAPTDTPLPTSTPTAVPSDTPVPTDTATVTNTATLVPSNTAVPTSTATPIPTDTPSVTPTFTNTATLIPTETYTSTPTLTPSATPLPTNTFTPTTIPFVPPQEFTTYTSAELHLSLDYPSEWNDPVYEEPFLLISPDGTNGTFPAAIITRGSRDYFAAQLGTEDVSSPQAFLEALVQTEENAEINKVSGYDYPTFELKVANDDLIVRGLLFVVNDNDWVLFLGAANPEIFDLFSESTFQQMATSLVVESIEPTATPTPIPSNTPRPTATLPPTWTPTATPVPILGETYEDEDAGFAFSYPEGAEISTGENEVTVEAEVENIPGEIYFVRGRPEELADQGIICESRDPVEALRCINSTVEPTYTNRYEKFGSPAWFTIQNVETEGKVNAVVSYVVAAGPEWIFIRLTAPASDYTTANLQLFQPILDSVFIEVQPTSVFGRWGLR